MMWSKWIQSFRARYQPSRFVPKSQHNSAFDLHGGVHQLGMFSPRHFFSLFSLSLSFSLLEMHQVASSLSSLATLQLIRAAGWLLSTAQMTSDDKSTTKYTHLLLGPKQV